MLVLSSEVYDFYNIIPRLIVNGVRTSPCHTGNGPGTALEVEEVNGATVTVEGSDFNFNECAIDVLNPFVSSAAGAADVTLRRTKIFKNTCTSAAAVNVLNANVVVEDSTFTRNENAFSAAGLDVSVTDDILERTVVTLRDTGMWYSLVHVPSPSWPVVTSDGVFSDVGCGGIADIASSFLFSFLYVFVCTNAFEIALVQNTSWATTARSTVPRHPMAARSVAAQSSSNLEVSS